MKNSKILSVNDIPLVANKLVTTNKHIVVAGGCFDILHEGHFKFLSESKKQGDILFLLLESDARIRKLKGPTRPVNSQKNRARVLAQLPTVDYIVLLPTEMTNDRYDQLILQIKPVIITTTADDPYRTHKVRQAALVGGKVVSVIRRIPHLSTSHIVEHMTL